MKADQLRKSILKLAIQGKLVPQDPNDEPASVLLERIREEKQKLIKEGKSRKIKMNLTSSKVMIIAIMRKCSLYKEPKIMTNGTLNVIIMTYDL